MNNIVLIGFMGTGKTSVARELRRLTGMLVVDMDGEIEKTAGMPVSDIFAVQGEEAFRDMETELLTSLSMANDRIVSTGGGVVLRPQNRRLLKKTGLVVWLTADPGEIACRLQGDRTRPLLHEPDGRKQEERIVHMLQERKKLYEKCADMVIDTKGRSPLAVAQLIWEMTDRRADHVSDVLS